jgi:sigma-B regulation protein RsbU (phosphoserine phosphatase)
VDTAARTIYYGNAGHNPPVLVRTDGRVERLLPTGLVLGVTADWTYTTGMLDVQPGDRLVCFTDGLTEADSPAGDEFGDDRLVDLIRAHRTESADDLATALADALAAFTGGAAQDDATLIVVTID